MVTINTSEDIIRALREDPHLLHQVQRAIMTDQLLALPGQFAAMRETQNAMLETQNRILADLAETRETQNAMLETQNRILADLAETRRDIPRFARYVQAFSTTTSVILEERMRRMPRARMTE